MLSAAVGWSARLKRWQPRVRLSCVNNGIHVGRYAWALIIALSVAGAGFGAGEIVLVVVGLMLLASVAGVLTSRLSATATG